MLWNKKDLSKKKKVPFDLLLEEVPPIPEFCPVLGIPLKTSCGYSGSDYSPSLDRIIPELGYTKTNVIWVSNLCNRIKSDSHWFDMERVALFYKELIPDLPIPKRAKNIQEVSEELESKRASVLLKNEKLQSELERLNRVGLDRAKATESMSLLELEMRSVLKDNPYKVNWQTSAQVKNYFASGSLGEFVSTLSDEKFARMWKQAVFSIYPNAKINKHSKYRF